MISYLDKLSGLHEQKRKARVSMASCRARGAVFPHTLLYGVGGTGKTALARSLALDLNYFFVETEAANLTSRPAVLEKLISSTELAEAHNKYLLLFIDEIHRLSLDSQEALYYPMKEWWVTTQTGRVTLPHFCLFGATTRRDMLDGASFLERFPNVWKIDRYPLLDMCEVVAGMFLKQEITADPNVVTAVARRSLGIPRRASKLVEWVRDQALYRGSWTVVPDDVEEACELHGIDELGLDDTHRRYMMVLANDPGRPKGVGTLAMSLEEPEDALRGMVEPILLAREFVQCTPRGRIITSSGLEYIQNR